MLKSIMLIGGHPKSLWAVKRRLRDYANVGRHLLIQRIVIYFLAILLSGIYYDGFIAVCFLVGVALCETFDSFVFLRIVKRETWTLDNVRDAMIAIYAGTVASAVTISAFCIGIAHQQGVADGHFFPLFILVSATMFATMNNAQLLSVLCLRLSIYIFAILFIPIHDLWVVRPPLNSEKWLNLFTVMFVLGFIMELGRNFLAGYSRDLRARLKLEDDHRLTKEALNAKTRFLATVNHELRTPLTSIKGAFDLINSGALGSPPEKMHRLFDIAARNTHRLSDLVDDLLFIQAADIGRTKFDFRTLDLSELVEEAVERFQPHAAKMEVTLDPQYPAGEYLVQADRKRIDQVIMNLLSNAAKFSRKNGVVTIALETCQNTIRFSVRDTGIGIQEGSEDQVFAEFTQLDSGDEREYEGTGLGLSISKRIVEAHHGVIGYRSELGTGSEFYFELERAAPDQAPDSANLPNGVS